MAENTSETSNPQPRIGRLTKRGLMRLGLGAATTAVLGSISASPSIAQAQNLFEPSPKPGEKKPGAAGPKTENQGLVPEQNVLGVGRLDLLRPDDSRNLETSIKRRPEVVEHFLPVRAGEPRSNIEVKVIKASPGSGTEVREDIKEDAKKIAARDFSMTVSLDPNDAKPDSQVILETDELLSQFIINSNNSKDLVQNFDLAFQKYAKLNLNKISNGIANEKEMVAVSDAVYLFDFSSYSGGGGTGDLYKKREKLAETFLVNTFAIWISQSDQLSQILADIAVIAPPFGSAMANVFLFGLRMLEGCADNPQAFDSLGIKKSTLKNIVKVSGNEDFENHFKGKGL